MHEQLPKSAQAPQKRYKQSDGSYKAAKVSWKRKLGAVYENMGNVKFDLAAALACYAKNKAEDEVIGKLSKGASRGARYTGREFGLGVGGYGRMN